MNGTPSILWVLVAYKRSDRLISFVEHLCRLPGFEEIQLSVVFNQPDIGEYARLQAKIRDLGLAADTLVMSSENLGYFGGAERALKANSEDGHHYRYVILSNYDLIFPSEDFLQVLIEMSVEPSVGVVGPRVTSLMSGREQSPFLLERPSALRMSFYEAVFSRYWAHRAFNWFSSALQRIKRSRREPGPTENKRPEKVYAVHGSFFIFTQEFFSRGCELGYPGFLFGEEIYAAEQCRAVGLDSVVNHGLVVQHEEHAATGHVLSRLGSSYRARSSRFLNRTFFRGQQGPSDV